MVFSLVVQCCQLIAVSAPPIQQDISDLSDETVRGLGAKIFDRKCSVCHGDHGEGNEDVYPDPLTGDATVSQLAALISETMPEEDPDACVGDDAEAVAKYIHHKFYSEAAQVRRRPPRIALARLTANQLRQSLADLYTHFGNDPWTQDERGLSVQYFDHKHWKKEKLKIERVDPLIDFDFAANGPGEGIDAKEFYINWTGSLLAMETGRYEIVVHSSCAFTLDFGTNQRRLINNAIQSAGKDEFREVIQLTGGRCYPIKLQLYQRKRKTEQPDAKISLQWVPPGGVQEIIPTAHLMRHEFPATFALQSKLPPDDRSYGYKRGTAIDRSWDQSTTDAALEFAAIAVSELYPNYLQQKESDEGKDRGHLRSFLVRLVSTAFRRPLDTGMQKYFVDRHIQSNQNDGDAIKLVVLTTIKSPRFLYPLLDQDRSKSWRHANRLALTLYDSLPSDSWFIKAAKQNQISESDQVTNAAWRMVGDYRCRAKTRELIYHWLDLDQVNEITKDQSLYPGFDAALVADLRKSLDAFIDDVIYSEASDFRQLLQADWMFTTPRIESFYGDAWRRVDQEDGSLQRSVSDSVNHVGLLSHPILMSKLSYHRTSSPIHRGVFLTRHVLGRVLRPPNAAFSPLNPDLHPGLTTRQRVHLQTDERSCQVCHSKINPLGFALEQFDAVGRFRLKEKGQVVDASGSYVTRDDQAISFDGVRELGDYLAGSQDCHQAFVEAAFEHFVKQPIAAYGSNVSSELTKRFVSSGFSIRQLIVWIAEIASNPMPNRNEQVQ